MTLRQLISQIRGSHRLLSTDSTMNDRMIASEIRSSAFMLLKRETNLRRLWQTDTLFTTLPCIPLTPSPISQCLTWADDTLIARSEILPRIAEGNYQYLIQGVYSINILGGRGKKIEEITLNRYQNLSRLPVKKKQDYFFIHDSRLYITNPFLEKVTLKAFFEEDVPLELIYPLSCGYSIPEEICCVSPLDLEFPLPGYLTENVLSLVSKKLLDTFFRLKEDLSSDGIDGQAPNAPQGK